MTLLEMVQSILDSLDSDDVNSIDETEESLQVVGMIKDTLYALLSDKEWPHLHKTCKLLSVGSTSRPTELQIPESVSTITDVRYDITETGDSDTTYRTLTYLDPADFLDRSLRLSSSATTTETVTLSSGTILFVENDKMPQYWTSFDDEFLVLDSFDNTEESTVQGSKTIIMCTEIPTWTPSDTFVPDIPINMFPLFLAESCLLYTSPSPRDATLSRMPSSA